MSELPRQAKDLLVLAKDVHDPPDGARERVRRAVAIGVGVSAAAVAGKAVAGKAVAGKAAAGAALGSGAPQAAKAGVLASFGAKLAVVTTTLTLVGTTAVIAPRWAREAQPPVAPPAQRTLARTAEPAASPEPLPSPMAAEEPSPPAAPAAIDTANGASPSTAVEGPKHGLQRSRGSGENLAAEVAVLRIAAEAIARDEPRRALDFLDRHRAGFATPALREEREGLRLLARCRLDPNAARRIGAAFLARNPGSLLGRRVEKACGLEGGDP